MAKASTPLNEDRRMRKAEKKFIWNVIKLIGFRTGYSVLDE